MWACASSAFRLTRPAVGHLRLRQPLGLRADPPTKAAPARFVFAEYLAIAHLKADELVTVDLELAAVQRR
jgi:hypothetical protein